MLLDPFFIIRLINNETRFVQPRKKNQIVFLLMIKKMNLDAIKCFICSSNFKTNRTFTLVSLGKERLWFCNRHIPTKKALQNLSNADALSELVNQRDQFIHPKLFSGGRRHAPASESPLTGGWKVPSPVLGNRYVL